VLFVNLVNVLYVSQMQYMLKLMMFKVRLYCSRHTLAVYRTE